jgi:hypothetical protein
MVLEGHDDEAFLLPFFVASEFVKVKRDGDDVYRILDEFFVPSQRIFLFQKNSPYIEEFGSVVLQLKQAGLTELLYDNGREENEINKESVFLTLTHLQSVFVFLLLGYAASFVCFLFEIMNRRIKIFY